MCVCGYYSEGSLFRRIIWPAHLYIMQDSRNCFKNESSIDLSMEKWSLGRSKLRLELTDEKIKGRDGHIVLVIESLRLGDTYRIHSTVEKYTNKYFCCWEAIKNILEGLFSVTKKKLNVWLTSPKGVTPLK